MDVLLLFDDFIVIYLFNYAREAPMFVVFFVTDLTAAQQAFKYLYVIFSCTCPVTVHIEHANKDECSKEIVKLFYCCPDLQRK